MVIAGDQIGRRFLKDTDEYLAANWKSITCDDMANLYYRFFCDLKDYKGNANGFTGLSEYLLFRTLIHRFGGGFERIPVTQDLFEFQKGGLVLGQSTPVIIGGKKYYPDIVVRVDEKLVAIIQVKVYLTNGRKEIDKEVETLHRIREKHPDVQCNLVIFGAISPNSAMASHLAQQGKEVDGFHSLVLRGNHNLLSEELDKWLPVSIL